VRFYLILPTLLENYVHIGFQKTQLNHAYRPYIIGSYSSISIINPIYIISMLRKVLRLILHLTQRNLRVCFVTQQAQYFLNGKRTFKKQGYVLNYWAPGTLTNRRYSLVFGRRNRIIRLRRIPTLLVAFGLLEQKIFSLAKEVRSRSILFCPLLDSDSDPSLYTIFLLTNTKSSQSVYFLVNLFILTITYSRKLVLKKFKHYVFKKKRI